MHNDDYDLNDDDENASATRRSRTSPVRATPIG